MVDFGASKHEVWERSPHPWIHTYYKIQYISVPYNFMTAFPNIHVSSTELPFSKIYHYHRKTSNFHQWKIACIYCDASHIVQTKQVLDLKARAGLHQVEMLDLF